MRDSFGVGVGFQKQLVSNDILSNRKIFFAVGDGCKGKFWKGKRCNEELLYKAFPSLFPLLT